MATFSEVRYFNISSALYITVFISLAYVVISAWDELLDFLFLQMYGPKKKDTIGYHLSHVMFYTIVIYGILYIMDEDMAYLYGIPDILRRRRENLNKKDDVMVDRNIVRTIK